LWAQSFLARSVRDFVAGSDMPSPVEISLIVR
jgi:hypothetical protein